MRNRVSRPTSATHENVQPVGRRWYALLALVLLVFGDIFTRTALLSGLPILAVLAVVLFSVAGIKAQKIFDPTQSVWGRTHWRDAALLALAVVLMQAVWHWMGSGIERKPLSDSSTWIQLFLILVGAPIFEEVIFRGLIYRVFDFGCSRAAIAAQITLSAIAFAAFHITYWQTWALGLVFVAGLIFAFARFRSGGILLPIMLHFLMNALAVGGSLWP